MMKARGMDMERGAEDAEERKTSQVYDAALASFIPRDMNFNSTQARKLSFDMMEIGNLRM